MSSFADNIAFVDKLEIMKPTKLTDLFSVNLTENLNGSLSLGFTSSVEPLGDTLKLVETVTAQHLWT